jgi:DNA polymerase-3 subunit delta'
MRPPAPGEPTGIFLAQMQTLRRHAFARPAMGARKVFVIGGAEKLVPQESSPEAANALLKLLEEPPDDTTLILTASDPDALLPTIRSRLLPVRLRALPEQVVAEFLEQALGIDAADARLRARVAEGSIGRALGYGGDGPDVGTLEELRQQARAMLAAALDDAEAARLQLAHAQSPAGARGSFSDVLEQLARWIRDLAAAATGADELIINLDAREWLHARAARSPVADGAAPAIAAVEQAMDLAQGNVNPQLILADLLRTLREVLGPPVHGSDPARA